MRKNKNRKKFLKFVDSTTNLIINVYLAEIYGLSFGAVQAISSVSDSVHNALYEHCAGHYVNSNATIRFSKLLHLLSKIAVIIFFF